MSWIRSDDQAADHPKVLKAQSAPRPRTWVPGPEAFACMVYGAVQLTASWSSSKEQDGWVTEAALRRVAGADVALLGKAAVYAGLFSARERREGEWGWQIVEDDLLINLKKKAEKEAEARYRRQLRDPDFWGPVRKRDGDQCRYCGKTVIWKDNKSARGGLTEHVIPGGDVAVVSCRECNGKKGSNAPEDAGLILRDPPAKPYYSDYTRSLLIKHGYLEDETDTAATTRPTPDTAATTRLELDTAEVLEQTLPAIAHDVRADGRTGTDDQRAGPVTGAADRGLPDQVRAGSGRVGTGPGQAGEPCSTPSLSPVPTRRKRARRRKPRPPEGTDLS